MSIGEPGAAEAPPYISPEHRMVWAYLHSRAVPRRARRDWYAGVKARRRDLVIVRHLSHRA